MTPRVCAIVPSYNHYRAVAGIASYLCTLGLTVFVVDDASDEPAASVLAALHDRARGVVVNRLPTNHGKGGAVCAGFRLANAAGFTHVLQIDADGQHDLDAVPELLVQMAHHPEALVCGSPIFDATMPMGRKTGRWVTHVWVAIETLTLRRLDTMCGLRVYPLEPVLSLMKQRQMGSRMDFDIEIVVRLAWRGIPIATVPVNVAYPADNISNFHPLRDNARISWMHARLVVEMLSSLLLGRVRRATFVNDAPPVSVHWAALSELGAGCGIMFCVFAYRLLGRRGCRAVLALIAGFFYLAAGDRRQASQDFLQRAFTANGIDRSPGWRDGLQHFRRFADRTLDGFIGWIGGLPADMVVPDDPRLLAEFEADPRGAVVIVAHVGNAEVSRAVLTPALRARLVVLTHTHHAENFNRILHRYAPNASVNMLQVSELGPETAIKLRDLVALGHWVVIAGDRTPVGSRRHTVPVTFLGQPAPLAYGPYVLASVLECPVWLLFCRAEGTHYRLMLERFAERIVLPRGSREAEIAILAERYAERLEVQVRADPFQWYNFFDFWAEPHSA